jgi:hypothetical protein
VTCNLRWKSDCPRLATVEGRRDLNWAKEVHAERQDNAREALGSVDPVEGEKGPRLSAAFFGPGGALGTLPSKVSRSYAY